MRERSAQSECSYGKLSPYGFIKYGPIWGAGTSSFWTAHMMYLLEWWSNWADLSCIPIMYVGLNYFGLVHGSSYKWETFWHSGGHALHICARSIFSFIVVYNIKHHISGKLSLKSIRMKTVACAINTFYQYIHYNIAFLTTITCYMYKDRVIKYNRTVSIIGCK